MAKRKSPTKPDKVELSETELDEISGGPHFRTFDRLGTSLVDEEVGDELIKAKKTSFVGNGT